MDSEDFDRRETYLRALRRTGSTGRAASESEVPGTESNLNAWRLDPNFRTEEQLVLDDLEVQADLDDAPKPVPEAMVDEYRSGVTIQALSDEYGTPRETIRGRLKRAGVRLRPRGRRPMKRKRRRTR